MSYTEIRTATVTVRKRHSCEWCAEQILPGERAFYRAYVFEGDFNQGRMHPECEKAMHTVPNCDLRDGWMAGDYKRGTAEAA